MVKATMVLVKFWRKYLKLFPCSEDRLNLMWTLIEPNVVKITIVLIIGPFSKSLKPLVLALRTREVLVHRRHLSVDCQSYEP
jgi:hypothetical protein